MIRFSTRPGASQRVLKLFWFGHGSNFAAVVDFISELQQLSAATPHYAPQVIARQWNTALKVVPRPGMVQSPAK